MSRQTPGHEYHAVSPGTIICAGFLQVEGGIVPTLKHKFFETDLPYGLCTFVDIARMIGVDTPLIDAMIRWNQVRPPRVFVACYALMCAISPRVALLRAEAHRQGVHHSIR